MRTCLVSLSAFAAFSLLAGCGISPADIAPPIAAHVEIQGTVFGAQSPVVGAHVYLLAANTTGYGNASVPLLNNTNLSSDSLGYYVSTGSDGGFSLSGDYTACSAGSTTQVYLYALGGNPGAGSNSASGMMAALGTCANITSSTHVALNEVSTVAAAYAMAGYAVDATHVSSSGSTLAQTGIANAFANSGNLVGLASGTALTTTPAGNGTVPYQTIYTLSNILAACINSADTVVNTVVTHSGACNTLLTTATADGTSTGTQPTDTATAIINIAHHPTANVTTLYGLPTGTPPYTGLNGQPSDFTLTLVFTGGGLSSSRHIGVDGSGNIWSSDYSNRVEEFSPRGSVLSGSSGYTDSSLNGPTGLAIDTAGDCYVVNGSGGNSTITEFNAAGSKAANPSLSAIGNSMAFDASGDLWAPNNRSNNDGVLAEIVGGSVTNTYNIAYEPSRIASDRAGNLWIGNINGGDVLLEVTGGSVAATYSMNTSATPAAVVLDFSSNVWELGSDTSLSAISSGGTLLSGAPYNTGNGFTGQASNHGLTMLFDGSGKLFTLNSQMNLATMANTYSMTEYSPSSGVLTTVATFTPPVPSGSHTSLYDIAADGSGNLWVAAGSQIDEIIGLTSPVVTPVVANLISPYGHPASRP